MTAASTSPRPSRCRPVVRTLAAVSLMFGASAWAGAAAVDPAGDTPPPAPHSHSGHATVRPDKIPPQDYAADGIARVEVAAHVDVAVHWNTMHQYHFTALVDTTAGGTGAFINPSGTLVTSSDAVRLDRERITVYAANQAWHRAAGMPLPANPYKPAHVKGNPRLQAAANSCYRPNNPDADCAVFITPEVTVHPYTTAGRPPALKATLLSTSGPVAVLSVASPGKTATVALGPTPRAGTPWTAIGWRAPPTATAEPATLKGHYSAQAGVPAKDIAPLRQRLGAGMSGSVLVDDRGAVTGLLSPTSHSAAVVPSDRITAALDRSGVQPARGPGDSSMVNGLALYAKHEYRHAATWLHSAAEDTGHGVVAVRYHEAAHASSGKPVDMSDEADAHTGHSVSSPGTNWPLIGALIGLAVLLAGVLLFTVWHRRGRLAEQTAAAGASHAGTGNVPLSTRLGRWASAKRAPPTGRTDMRASAPEHHEPSGLERSTPHERGAGGRPEPHGAYCVHCGALLSPGDRFCFSCGAAAYRP